MKHDLPMPLGPRMQISLSSLILVIAVFKSVSRKKRLVVIDGCFTLYLSDMEFSYPC